MQNKRIKNCVWLLLPLILFCSLISFAQAQTSAATSDYIDCGDLSRNKGVCPSGYFCSFAQGEVGSREGLCLVDDPLTCGEENSTHPYICPSGYYCEHMSGGVGFCNKGTAPTTCKGPNPSHETATTTVSCSCEIGIGSSAWKCSTTSNVPPVCSGPKPVKDVACSCDGPRGGTGVWDCGSSDNGTGFFSVSTTPCTGTDCNVDYKLLEPLPGLTGGIKDLSFAAMLGLAFKILITLGALVAVGTLVYSGIAYMLSSSPLETMGEAKRRMQSALWGLLILLGAWLLLNTINPQLVIFDLQLPGSEAAGPNPSGVKAVAGEATEADIRACRPGVIVPKEGGGWDCVDDF